MRYAEWTHDRHLRHPAYLGLRDDKAPAEVVREDVVRRGKRELKLSNLEKLFWPDEGITKGDLLRYYREVAPVLVPHLAHRAFTMRRYPDGAYGKAFFQKDAPVHMPDWIPRFRAHVSARDQGRTKKWIEFPVVNDELALLWMVNMGCIDMNAWYSRIDRPDRPDFVLFDLDPTPEVPWTQTVEVALILKQLLDTIGLASFPKTSGGKGFHVLVPLDRRSTYEDTRVVRGDRRRRDRPRAPEACDDRMVEGASPRRSDRRESERRGEDDRVCVLGAAPSGRARLDAASLGRGERTARSRRVHDGGRARAGACPRRPLRRRALDPPVAQQGAQVIGLAGLVRAASFATESSRPSITA